MYVSYLKAPYNGYNAVCFCMEAVGQKSSYEGTVNDDLPKASRQTRTVHRGLVFTC